MAGPAVWTAYKLVWKRRRLLWRALRSRHQLTAVADRTRDIRPGDLLSVVCVRNEAFRLDDFFAHYRGLGVGHFLFVDNESDDGTADYLEAQPDVSLWRTGHSYRSARFGLDWANWLLLRYGHGHWCLTVDADELLVFAHSDRLSLSALTEWLDERGQYGFGALMLDLYPKGALGEAATDENPTQWFDAGPYRSARQEPLQNLWTQGGVRERMFFADEPRRSPTLNKIPLMRWNRRFAYVNSTHSALPRRLNKLYDGPGGDTPSGVLLHTKFLPQVLEKAREDITRQQHFHDPQQFRDYYDKIAKAPILWTEASVQYEDWRPLVELKLLNSGGFGEG